MSYNKAMKLKLTARIETRTLAQGKFNLQASLSESKKILIDLYVTEDRLEEKKAKEIVKATETSVESISREVCENGSTYAPFIFNLIIKSFEGDDRTIGNLIDGKLENTEKLTQNLKKYHALKRDNKPGLKDIGTFKTIGELIDYLTEIEKVEPIRTESFGKLQKEVLDTFKEGKPITGADLLFKNDKCRIYRVEGTEQENVDALIMMSGKHPIEVKENSKNARRVWKECQWCTAFPDPAKHYLGQGPLIMFYTGQGRPVYELNTDDGGKFSFRDAPDGLKPLTELTQFIREVGVPNETREKIWDLIYGKKSISSLSKEKFHELANDIIDNPKKHPKSV